VTQEPAAPPPGAPDATPAPASGHTLPVGSHIGGLEITGLIGEGGFGIVYLAFDPTLQRQVALKEYMPSSLASRAAASNEVTVKSARHLDTFNAGLRSFVNEARLLAHFDHPALVKVHQFWQANRTAYMVMPYYQGPTLKAALRDMAAQGRTPDEAQLRRWLAPLLDALELMHAEQCYHRDVAPDNILLTSQGPLLLDFGAARRVISDMTHALTVVLKPGYAPIEQYGDAISMAQGAWTDLYALASCVYFAITGHSPITSVERVMGDPLPSLTSIAAGRYSATFLRAIDHALAVRPNERPQSVAEFRALLGAAPDAAGNAPRPAAGGALPAPPRKLRRSSVVVAFAALLALAFGLSFTLRRAAAPDAKQPAAAAAAAREVPAPTGSREAEPTVPPAVLREAASVPSVPTAAAPRAAVPEAPPPQATAKIPVPTRPAVPVQPQAKPAPAAPRAEGRPVPAVPSAVPTAPPAPSPPLPAPRLPVSPQAERPPEARPVPPAPKAKPARCAEILQKGQQQALSMDDVTYLRQECR
jgi:Protein kinase domain